MLVFIDDSGNPGFRIGKGSSQYTRIQLADMTAGSIFASYTSKDKSYLNKLKEARKVDNIWEFN